MDIELTEKEIQEIENHYLLTFRGKRLTWKQVNRPQVEKLVKALRLERRRVNKLKTALRRQYRWIRCVTKNGYGSFEGVSFDQWSECALLKSEARKLLGGDQ
jgi:galactokinase/mevalonate kinase-like predicted kinase